MRALTLMVQYLMDTTVLYILIWVVGIGTLAISFILKKVIGNALKRPNSLGLTGAELVTKAAKIFGIRLKVRVGRHWLGDYYDPRTDTINLSEPVANTKSVGAIAIAAHEFGHALQKHTGYKLLAIRNMLVPVVNIGTNLGTYLFFIGLLLGALSLAKLGLFLFGFAVFFTLLDLPIEFDASARALKLLSQYFNLPSEDKPYVKKVLFWAALTYLAAFANALVNFLYMASYLKNRD